MLPRKRLFAGKLKGYVSGFDRQLWLLFWGGVVGSLGHSVVFPFFSLYLYNEVGISMTMIGTGLAIGSVVGIFSQFFVGPLADTIGRRPVMLAGIFSSSILIFCYIFVSSFEQFLLLEILFGVSGSLYPTASRAMVADITPRGRRVQAYGLLYISHNVGGAIGPGLGGFIAIIGYQYLFGTAAGTEMVIFIIFLLFVKESIKRVHLKSGEKGKEGHEGIGKSVLGMRRVFYDRTFMLYSTISIVVISVYAMLYTILPVFAKNFVGVDEVGIGIMWMLNCAMVVGLQMPIARLIEYRNRGMVLFGGTLFYAVGFGGLVFAGDLSALILLMAVITIGENLITPASAALVADLSPEDMRGRYMAFQGIVWSMGFAIGPLAGGLMLDNAVELLWPVAGVTCLIASFGYLVIRRAPGVQPAGRTVKDERI